MIDPDVETDLRNFIASLARMCKGCIRMGYACATCPCSRATVLHERMKPDAHNLASEREGRAKACQKRRREIIRQVRRASPSPCFAIDIKVAGCAANMRSMVLADLVKEGILERHNMGVGKPPSYTITTKEERTDEGQV